MYAWMSRANPHDEFFNDVRLFTITLNVGRLIFRVHRAVAREGIPGLEYHYDDLRYDDSHQGYTRDELCTLIHNISNDYAERALLKILRKAVKNVLAEHEKSQRFQWNLQQSPQQTPQTFPQQFPQYYPNQPVPQFVPQSVPQSAPEPHLRGRIKWNCGLLAPHGRLSKRSNSNQLESQSPEDTPVDLSSSSGMSGGGINTDKVGLHDRQENNEQRR
ncbi:hypothetical protein O1611_g9339 [Lasiodiplodia mahajangana]|uniref:Uncharacterized protein n=1 Tax=Lasiodiplodia mahajangana TaxID=1108764 RepID=A0ACC2JAG4_9PEZI|nr:hypothetical protein O1611_g9339 [Lasiodiplodia mahajangana]